MLDIDTIYCADCITLMKDIEDNSIDLVLTDPPYNASNSKISVPHKNYRSVNEIWDKEFTLEYLNHVVEKLKPEGQLLVFCSYHLLNEYLSLINFRQILHWIKTNPMPAMSNYYGFAVEYILWYTKSNKFTFNKEYRIDYTNVFYSKVNGYKQTDHPTEKPLFLIEKLIKTHSKEGDLILDPFLGSGTTAVACIKTNRHYIGIELSQTYCDSSNKRIETEKIQLKLF